MKKERGICTSSNSDTSRLSNPNRSLSCYFLGRLAKLSRNRSERGLKSVQIAYIEKKDRLD